MSLWIAYTAGLLIHWVAKSQAVVASPISTTNSYLQWAMRNWRALLVRTFFSIVGFGMWTYDPQLSASILPVPLNIYTAAAYGYLAESLLELASARIAVLRGEIPRYNGK